MIKILDDILIFIHIRSINFVMDPEFLWREIPYSFRSWLSPPQSQLTKFKISLKVLEKSVEKANSLTDPVRLPIVTGSVPLECAI